MDKHNKVLRDLEARKCLKVIAGINNFDKAKVLQIVRAADQVGATCVDISAREDIVTEAIALAENTAIMVSSIKPVELLRAEELGATMLELGNFEALHEEGIYPSADEVLNWAHEIMAARKTALVSITVPGHLTVAEQVELATKLEELGVDMIQTEGASLVEAQSAGALGQIEKVRLTLANTVEISKALNGTFVLTASGISPDTAKLAIAAGAHGVGVGKYVNKLDTELEMLAAITALRDSVASVTTQVNAVAF